MTGKLPASASAALSGKTATGTSSRKNLTAAADWERMDLERAAYQGREGLMGELIKNWGFPDSYEASSTADF